MQASMDTMSYSHMMSMVDLISKNPFTMAFTMAYGGMELVVGLLE